MNAQEFEERAGRNDRNQHRTGQRPQHHGKRPFVKKPAQAPKLTGHELMLDELKKSGDSFHIGLTTGKEPSSSMQLVDFDKYTITVKYPTGLTRTYFKHAMEYIQQIAK